MKNLLYDVIVAGAGSSGVVAATQAARAGARTLLVEKTGLLGGTPVLNEVTLPGLFHAWGKQVIAGIGWEWVETAMREGGRKMPDFSRFREEPHWKLQIPVDRALLACGADRLVRESGAEILLHTMPAAARAEDGGWTLTLCCKEGLREVRGRVLVDCTGDGNLVRLAGCELRRASSKQPGTLMMRVGGYVLEDLDLDRMDAAFRDAVSRGEMSASDLPGSSPRHFLRVRGANAMHVPGVDGETSAGKTDAELKARAAMLRIYRFFRSQPGLESFTVESFAAECGIRETVVIEGETEIRVEEYESGTVYPDAVCFSFYPIDRHRPDGLGIDKRFLREGVVPTIPFGAMLPAGTSNLIAAGRMVCGDPLANSAYRVQASCMAMGQAAGAAAALASRQRLELREVSLPELRRLLVRHGALVPEPMT